MRLGLGLSLDIASAPIAAAFDPATLPLSVWLRADFSASPWVGTASADTSGSHSFSEATHPPTADTSHKVNGKTPALFNGTNQLLSGTTLDNIVTSAAGSFFALVKPVSVAAEAAAVYNNSPLWGDSNNGFMGAGVSANGFRLFIYNSVAGQYKSLTIPCSTGSYHFVAMTWNGTALFGQVDSTTDTIVAVGAALGSDVALIGSNYAGSVFGNFSFLEIGFSRQALSSTDLNNVKSYCNARYGLSL